MARVTKDPQIRMAEIINIAEELFNANGYQETQISDIVKAVGVAQGTFYYYFKSKENVVEAILKRKMDIILAEIMEIVEVKSLAAADKMSAVINTSINSIREREGVLFEYLYNDQRLHILDKLGYYAYELFGPPIKTIITEGIEQKCFTIEHMEATVEFIFSIIRVILDSLYKKEPVANQVQRFVIGQKLIEAMLGAKPGTISLKYR